MKIIDLTIPLGVGTPPWPTYEALQLKYFKRLAPNGANGQVLTHSNHLGTHLDGEIHFFADGKDIADLDFDFLVHEAAIVDLSDTVEDYSIYTSKMVEDRVEVKEGDILIINTGYHKYGWDQPQADEVRYFTRHPGPDREFSIWAKKEETTLDRSGLRQRGPSAQYKDPRLDAQGSGQVRRVFQEDLRKRPGRDLHG
jgi:arylformamidase